MILRRGRMRGAAEWRRRIFPAKLRCARVDPKAKSNIVISCRGVALPFAGMFWTPFEERVCSEYEARMQTEKKMQNDASLENRRDAASAGDMRLQRACYPS